MGLVVWLVVFLVCFAGLGVAAGDPAQRRPHFWLRLAMLTAVPLSIVLLAAALPQGRVGAMMGVFCFMAIPALMFVPALLYRTPGSSGGSDDDGGGGGRGPDRPPASPLKPRGGLPLPDAEQARTRVRDHRPAKLREAQPRRSAREPGRRPVRIRPDR